MPTGFSVRTSSKNAANSFKAWSFSYVFDSIYAPHQTDSLRRVGDPCPTSEALLFSRRSSRRLSSLSAGALFAVLFFVTATNGPERMFAQGPSVQLIAGRNVNMVSGTEWPNGDPFLQRQNEPSIAASTRNPMHLLGGSNDYRTIDLPGLPGAAETGDAWLGL